MHASILFTILEKHIFLEISTICELVQIQYISLIIFLRDDVTKELGGT